MKKYVKPDIYFESFQLTQHIAACGWDLELGSVDVCVSNGDNQGIHNFNNCYAELDGPAFSDMNTDCKMKYEGYCYTPGADDMFAVFNSQ